MFGAGARRLFPHFLVPLLTPGILAAPLLTLVRTIATFELTFFTSGSDSDTLVVALYSEFRCPEILSPSFGIVVRHAVVNDFSDATMRAISQGQRFKPPLDPRNQFSASFTRLAFLPFLSLIISLNKLQGEINSISMELIIRHPDLLSVADERRRVCGVIGRPRLVCHGFSPPPQHRAARGWRPGGNRERDRFCSPGPARNGI